MLNYGTSCDTRSPPSRYLVYSAIGAMHLIEQLSYRVATCVCVLYIVVYCNALTENMCIYMNMYSYASSIVTVLLRTRASIYVCSYASSIISISLCTRVSICLCSFSVLRGKKVVVRMLPSSSSSSAADILPPLR